MAAQGRFVKRIFATPLFLQSHITECGAACLGSILAHYGRWVTLYELREQCCISRDGSSAADILRAAKHYGLEGSGKALDVKQLRGMTGPLILYWEFYHFVVLEGYDSDAFYLNDPATGRRTVTLEEFSKSFTGVVLQLRPGPDFEPGGMRKSLLGGLAPWIRESRVALSCAFLYGFILSLLALVAPALMVIFVDQVLGRGEPWGWFVCASLAGVAVIVFFLTWLKQQCLARMAVKVAVIAGDHIMSKMMRLPLEFFSHRHTSELVGRMLSVDRISSGLAMQFTGLLIEFGMSVVFFVVLLAVDAVIALLVAILVLVNLALMSVVTRRRIEKSQILRHERELLPVTGVIMLQQTDVLRLRSEDDNSFSRWAGMQCRELTAYLRFTELGHVMRAMPLLILAVGNATVLAAGATRVLNGELTLGMLAGAFILTIMIMAPVRRFAEFVDDRQVLEAELQRLDDMNEIPEPPVPVIRRQSGQSVATESGRLQLTGRLELRNITFGYKSGKPPLIKNFSMTILPGQRVALVGPSGSGKSTISRLIAGVYQPWSGEILFDGLHREEIPKEVLARSLSLVDQQTTLFSGTVRDNITLWNSAIPDEMVAHAGRDACIHDFIISQPSGYGTSVETNGSNFSGGQKQRIEIARALIGNPSLLILDEGTSALDAKLEEEVDHALRRRGMACLIIAHRFSTVRDADEILVIDKGEEVQRGTHELLFSDMSGLYRKLVQED